jgi:hypothetical protein
MDTARAGRLVGLPRRRPAVDGLLIAINQDLVGWLGLGLLIGLVYSLDLRIILGVRTMKFLASTFAYEFPFVQPSPDTREALEAAQQRAVDLQQLEFPAALVGPLLLGRAM